MSTTTAAGMTLIHSEDEIPVLATEEEEVAFWASHSLASELIDRAEPLLDGELPPPRPRTRPAAIRFEEHVLHRLKSLAARRGTGYQTLLKDFVLERLYEEEKREGLIGAAELLSPEAYQSALRDAATRIGSGFGLIRDAVGEAELLFDAEARARMRVAVEGLRAIVAASWTASGTNTGPLIGLTPTGKKVAVSSSTSLASWAASWRRRGSTSMRSVCGSSSACCRRPAVRPSR